MKKSLLIFMLVAFVIAGMVMYYLYAGATFNVQELFMVSGLVLVILFAMILAVRRIRSLRKNQPAEDELSRSVMKRAAGTSYYLALYSWLVLMYLSDRIDMDNSTLIGLGILIMAVEFAIAWIWHNYFGRINE